MDIVTQITAIHAALDKVGLGLLDGHARVCMTRANAAEPRIDELMGAVGRMLDRG